MQDYLFRHISPDPQSKSDMVPAIFFWQTHDIMLGARFILRRRRADEILDRARLITAKFFEYEQNLVEEAIALGEPFAMNPDEGTLLKEIIMPERAFPFRRVKEDEKDGSSVPFVPVEGWLEAEDLAIFALLKVDQALDALGDEMPEDTIVCAGGLLDAYRCLLLAERARGRDIMTREEFETFKKNYLQREKEKISETKRKAVQCRERQKLKDSVLEKFHCMRLDRPDENPYALADEIADEYVASHASLPLEKRAIFPTTARDTFRRWVKQTLKTPQKEQPKVHPPETHQSIRHKLSEKNKF